MGVRTCRQCHKKVASHFKTCPFCKGALPGSGKRPGGLTLSQAVKNLFSDLYVPLKARLDAWSRFEPKPQKIGNKNAAQPTANLIECKNCGEEVTKNAKSCPNCGSAKYDAAAVKAENIFNIVVLLVLIYALYQCAGVLFGDSEPDKQYVMSEAEKLEDDKDKAYIGAQATLKPLLRDPDSLQVIQYAVMEHKTDSSKLTVYLEYRSKNGFGGYVANTAWFYCVRGSYRCALAADD